MLTVQHNTCPICRQSVGESTVDVAASILLPDSTSESSSDDEEADYETHPVLEDLSDILAMDVDGLPQQPTEMDVSVTRRASSTDNYDTD